MASTRASLIARIQQRANTSGYADASPGGEISQLVDVSLARLHNVLAGELYEDFFQKRKVYNMVQGTATYPLPPDFMKMRAMFYLTPNPSAPADVNQASRYLLRRVDPTDEQNYQVNGVYPNLPYGYVLEDRSIAVVPVPTAGSAPQAQLLMFYIPCYVASANDQSPIEFEIAPGWEEWCVNDVTHMIRMKAMMPSDDLVRERDAFMERVRIQAKNRNAVDAPRVRDTGWKYGNAAFPWGNFSFR